jgi:hypothetical protein
MAAVGLGVAAGPASATGAVYACNGTCIVAYTGAKNASNHTQYVSQLEVDYPSSWSPFGYLEGWAGNGPTGVAWYQSATGTSHLWTINQWIKTGSGVCGAYNVGGSRSVVCITISA